MSEEEIVDMKQMISDECDDYGLVVEDWDNEVAIIKGSWWAEGHEDQPAQLRVIAVECGENEEGDYRASFCLLRDDGPDNIGIDLDDLREF